MAAKMNFSNSSDNKDAAASCRLTKKQDSLAALPVIAPDEKARQPRCSAYYRDQFRIMSRYHLHEHVSYLCDKNTAIIAD